MYSNNILKNKIFKGGREKRCFGGWGVEGGGGVVAQMDATRLLTYQDKIDIKKCT